MHSEYSLWMRDPDGNGALAACKRLGVARVPYRPLGGGFLGGWTRSPGDFEADDYRRANPRFRGGNLMKRLNA